LVENVNSARISGVVTASQLVDLSICFVIWPCRQSNFFRQMFGRARSGTSRKETASRSAGAHEGLSDFFQLALPSVIRTNEKTRSSVSQRCRLLAAIEFAYWEHRPLAKQVQSITFCTLQHRRSMAGRLRSCFVVCVFVVSRDVGQTFGSKTNEGWRTKAR